MNKKIESAAKEYVTMNDLKSGYRLNKGDRFFIHAMKKFYSNILVHRDGCHIYKNIYKNRSYGIIGIGKKYVRVHRLSYIIEYGKIKSTNVLDHICRNKACVNPKHLREVTQSINAIENSLSPSANNYKKTHCIYGHAFSKKNTIKRKTLNGGRDCLKCHKRRNLIWDRKQRGIVYNKKIIKEYLITGVKKLLSDANKDG